MCVCVCECVCLVCAILISCAYVYLEGIGTTPQQPHETTKFVNRLYFTRMLWSTLKTDTTKIYIMHFCVGPLAGNIHVHVYRVEN